MDVGWQYKILLLFCFFIFSAFFSGSEVALFSLDRRKLKLSINGSLIERYLLSLLEAPRRLLVTILIGNTIVNVAASIVAVSLALDYAGSSNTSADLALTVQIILLTILVILLGELTPKVWAAKDPVNFSKIVAFPLYWINVIFYPVAETLTEIIKFGVSKIRFSSAASAISHEEFAELADLSHERGTIIEEEHGLIQSIVGFKNVTAGEVMTPRVDMVTIPYDTNFKELLEIITSTMHSRIPLYRDDLDEIIGIIYAKDILPYIKEPEKQKNLNLIKLARKPMFVPKSKLINDLMYEFQEKKMHIAIVVDEYGGTAGLVSLEDLIEEVIGEIHDEYDKEEEPFIKLDEDKFIVLGKISIDELNELLNTDLSSEENEFETAAGLVLNNAGHIPREGYSFSINNWKLTVKEVLNKRIKKVLAERINTV